MNTTYKIVDRDGIFVKLDREPVGLPIWYRTYGAYYGSTRKFVYTKDIYQAYDRFSYWVDYRDYMMVQTKLGRLFYLQHQFMEG